jgi:ketosteroid isomerase-like protein
VSEANVEVVRALFDGYAARGIDGVLAVVREDVVIEIPPDMSAEPDSYHGHSGVRRYFEGFAGMIEDVTYEAGELVPVGERYVLAEAAMGGRGVTSGLDVTLEVVVLHELEDGRVVRMRPYPDMESARAAAR